MSATIMNHANATTRLLSLLITAATLAIAVPAQAAAPGITGAAGNPVFNLVAQPNYISQPDGQMVYSWGYGCDPAKAPTGYSPAAIKNPFCKNMQVPGPTLIVTEGDTVTVKLTNQLPTPAGNTSILFPGFQLIPPTDGVPGLLTQEAAPGGTVTY